MPKTRHQARQSSLPTPDASTRKRRADDADELGDATPPLPTRVTKRVRFSNISPATSTTGLTPFVKRTSLLPDAPTGGPSTPSRRGRARSSGIVHEPLTPPATPFGSSPSVEYFPLRQSLTPRTRRQLKRNHLSEEQNALLAEQKQDGAIIAGLNKEIADLQWQLETQRQNAIQPDVLDEQQQQRRINVLQDELERFSGGHDATARSDPAEPISPAPTGASVDLHGFQDEDDTIEFGYDVTTAWADESLETSPLQSHDDIPDTPISVSKLSFEQRVTVVDRTTQTTISDPQHKAVQTSLPDLRHEAEVQTLQSKLAKVTTAHADKQLALAVVHESLQRLGFGPGETDDELTTVLSDMIRNTRLQLEEILPGETVCGAADGPALLQALLDHIRKLLAGNQGHVTQAHELRTQVSAAEGSVAALQANFKAALAQKAELQQELAVVNEHRTELIASAASSEEGLAQRRDELRIMSVQLDDSRHDVAQLNQVVDDLTISNRRLQDALEQYRGDCSTSEGLLREVERQLVETKKQLVEERRQLVEEEKQHAATKDAYTTLQHEVQERAYGLVACTMTGMIQNVAIRAPRREKTYVRDDSSVGVAAGEDGAAASS